jgi:hypothetical protein
MSIQDGFDSTVLLDLTSEPYEEIVNDLAAAYEHLVTAGKSDEIDIYYQVRLEGKRLWVIWSDELQERVPLQTWLVDYLEMQRRTRRDTPVLGGPATIQFWSDRHAGTVIALGSRIVTIQIDISRLISGSIQSESQRYEYERDPNGAIFKATKRQDGTWRLMGEQARVTFSGRHAWRDPSF